MAQAAEMPIGRTDESLRGTAIVAYILYLLGWPTIHLTTIAGLVLAYVQRREARGTIWESHFSNLTETFWIAIIVAIVAVPLCFVVIGIPILLGLAVWVLFRTIKGLIRAIESQPYV